MLAHRITRAITQCSIILFLCRIFDNLLTPRTTNHRDVFRERTIRYVTTIAVIVFTLLALMHWEEEFNTRRILWYLTIYLFAFCIFAFLHRRQLRYAAHSLSCTMILMVIDQSAAYWSPGTIMFMMMYSLLFHMIYEHKRDIIISVTINLLIYVWITLITLGTAPLSPWDYFSSPLSALMLAVMVNMIMFRIADNIRQEQYERDQIEISLERYKADILRQFLGSTSHDFRTMLSHIRNKMYFLQRTTTDDGKRHLTELETSISKLEQSLLAMIEMSQLDDQSRFEPDIFVLNELISQLMQEIAPLAKAKSIKLDCIEPPNSVRIHADAHLLRRALDNVLKNAVDYTDTGGQITVALMTTPELAQIVVRDTGIGINPHDLLYIFERFYRADKARTNPYGRVGLGLAITRKIMELHHGQILVTSEPGKGSTFTLQLPLAVSGKD